MLPFNCKLHCLLSTLYNIALKYCIAIFYSMCTQETDFYKLDEE